MSREVPIERFDSSSKRTGNSKKKSKKKNPKDKRVRIQNQPVSGVMIASPPPIVVTPQVQPVYYVMSSPMPAAQQYSYQSPPLFEMDARVSVIHFLQQLPHLLRSQIEEFISNEIKTKTNEYKEKVRLFVNDIQSKTKEADTETEETIRRLKRKHKSKYEHLHSQYDDIYAKYRRYKQQCRDLKSELENHIQCYHQNDSNSNSTPRNLTPQSNSTPLTTHMRLLSPSDEDESPPPMAVRHSAPTRTQTPPLHSRNQIQSAPLHSSASHLSIPHHSMHLDLEGSANESWENTPEPGPPADDDHEPARRESKLHDLSRITSALSDFVEIAESDDDVPPPIVTSIIPTSTSVGSNLSGYAHSQFDGFFDNTSEQILEERAFNDLKLSNASHPGGPNYLSGGVYHDVDVTDTATRHLFIGTDFQTDTETSFPRECEFSRFTIHNRMQISLPFGATVLELKKKIGEKVPNVEWRRLLMRFYKHDELLTSAFGRKSNPRLNLMTELIEISNDDQTLEECQIKEWDIIRVRLAVMEGNRTQDRNGEDEKKQ